MSEILTLHTPDKSELFWQLVESQHGEVRAFGLAQYFAKNHPNNQDNNTSSKNTPHWGITYITDKGLFFYHFPQGSIISSLFGQKSDSGFCITLLFSQIESWQSKIPKKGLRYLFQKQTHGLFISATGKALPLVSPENNEKSLTYTNDFKKNLILDSLCMHTFLLDTKELEILTCLRNYIGEKEIEK